jgi:hypothetical protein
MVAHYWLAVSSAGRSLDESPSECTARLEGTPKTVTLSREVDGWYGWYACFSCADVPIPPLPATGQETGLDLGIEACATLSDGTRIFNPGWYRKAERALKTAQRRVSRRRRGSNRRRKAIVLLAKAHQKVRRQRRDFHHKTALALVQQNDTSYHDALVTARQYAEESSLGKVHPRRGMGRVPHHPDAQGSMRRSPDNSRQSRVYLANL